jgi:hypothetical protein
VILGLGDAYRTFEDHTGRTRRCYDTRQIFAGTFGPKKADDNRLTPEIARSRAWQAVIAASGRLLSGGFGRWLGLSCLFLVAAVVQTWPLVLHASNSTVDWFQFPFDTWQFLWNLWWLKHALLDLQTNPFHTDALLSPQGSNLYLHALTPVNGVLSIPLQLATNNLILSWNILALLLFVFSGLGMYALSYRVNHNHVAALLSGYIFAFAPFVLMHFTGHWNISTTWPIPLFVLFLLRFQATGRLREAAAAGILWAILTYNWLEFGTDAALFLGLFLAYWSFVYLRRRDLERLSSLWRGFAVIAAVWFAVSSPLIVPGLQDVSSGEYLQSGGDEYFSGDLLTFVTPSPLWGQGDAFIFPTGPHLTVGSEEGTAYLGIVPLLLAGLAVFAVRRTPHRVLFWAMVFLVFAILSLGPFLYVGGAKTLSVLGVSFSVPLPYHIYDQLPIFGARRIPARMIIFGMVGLSVLAGTGFDLLTGWLRPRYGKIVPLAALLIFSLVVLEYWNPPVFLSQLSTPAILEEISDEPGDFTVLDAPLGRRNGYSFTGDSTGGPMTNYYQTIYEKRSFGGYLSRVSDRGFAWIMEQPGFAFLSCPRCEDLPSPDNSNSDLVRSLFREHKIRYVVLHKLDPRGQAIFWIGDFELTAMDEYLRSTVGMIPIYTDSAMTVYRNPEVGQNASQVGAP